MTIQELLAQVRKASEFNFGPWWFLNGGALHGAWKRRQYSTIRDAALTLPRLAAQHQHIQDAKLIESLLQIIELQYNELKFWAVTADGDSARAAIASTLQKLECLK